ncbi:hypothetical protein QBC47DRAFT_372876 [Echria macrotheca]|uniref:HECT-type E3 ubiquitin transferase n=1 Tax=Echria macrotheca TaxID=438768 RepID=A0AAJ0BMT4_9PEZI|nr:hypothetical protein QBC47DRAFT_372876 [Echria macrotheca]
MFPSFTGSSRKTRNVNLSGHRAINPFTSTSWSPGNPVGASKTVANAQAERQQRQRERDRLKAALLFQRIWRAKRVRRDLRNSRRQLLDELYGGGHTLDAAQRSARALPLLLAAYQASTPGDGERTRRVVQDLVDTGFSAFTSGAIAPARTSKLAKIITDALEKIDPSRMPSESQLFFGAIVLMMEIRPTLLRDILPRYYEVMGTCCQNIGPDWGPSPLAVQVVVAPLDAATADRVYTRAAYQAFASRFLTKPDLLLFEGNVFSFASKIDLEQLSEFTYAAASEGLASSGISQSASLWLLAHLIALHKANALQTLPARYLKALNSLLIKSSNTIREAFSFSNSRGSQDEEERGDQEILPSYVFKAVASLTDKNEITGFLDKFTVSHGNLPQDDSEVEDASFLAGFILTLIYCFPSLGDEIRLRLYLADVSTHSGQLPSVKFFWNAVSKTSIFTKISTDEDAALLVLQDQHRSTGGPDSRWHGEWRTILLFLELYVFVLRLTDDDDFFSGLDPTISLENSGSRLRSSSLAKRDLAALTRFLKHLGFTLYYHPPSTLLAPPEASGMESLHSTLSGVSPSPRDSVNAGKTQTESFVITSGITLTAFRSLVTTAVTMLYERDSRRPFFAPGHWLMTSKFDMNSFLSAVVLEEQRRQELRLSGDDEEEEGDADEMDMDEYSDFSFISNRRGRSRLAQVERMRARQKQIARESLRAANEPKLEILRNLPFMVPFEIRVQIFRQFVRLDMERRRGGSIDPDRWRFWVLGQHGGVDIDSPGHSILSKHRALIRRDHCFINAMDAFWELGDGLKEPIQITFVDEWGMQEAGIDGGGVTKEFLTSVTQQAFTATDRLFVTNSKNSYYPNPCTVDQRKEALRLAGDAEDSEEWRESLTDLFRQFEFLGRIIGKCMYEGILIDIVFAGFFLLKWASTTSETYRANINDLREMDEELYQGMMTLKTYPGDVSELDLDFTIEDQVSLPGEPLRTVTRKLMPNGDKVRVTNENRPLYISYVARHRLAIQPYAQTQAFLRGLGMIIEPGWLRMFNQNELQRLVGGDSSKIDVEDLRRHTSYSGLYVIGDDGEEHPTIKMFWEVMHGLDDGELREVLKFVTSTPRAPLLGFSQLRPAFSIRDGGRDETRLPSSSTCLNLLKLPQYSSAAVLKTKLLYAVKSGAGFDLS